jgi:hypothetical protein
MPCIRQIDLGFRLSKQRLRFLHDQRTTSANFVYLSLCKDSIKKSARSVHKDPDRDDRDEKGEGRVSLRDQHLMSRERMTRWLRATTAANERFFPA